jgi:hypothetical protein
MVCLLLPLVLIASCGLKPTAQAEMSVPSVPGTAVPEAAFRLVEGPEPSPEERYEGTLVAWDRWIDTAGEHLVVLSGIPRVPDGGMEAIRARHYRKASGVIELVDEVRDGPVPDSKEASAGYYRDDVFISDLDADGLGEAMFAYYVDPPSESVARRLELVVFTNDRRLSIRGTARHDRLDAPVIAAATLADQAMSDAAARIRDEAMELFGEAQYELAIPSPFPGFFPHVRFDGVRLRGDEPTWSLTMLPSFMAFTKGGETAALRYESMSLDGSTLTVEGTGLVEAWTHKFRITLIDNPGVAPDGTRFRYAVTMEWSDGTRLSGWGGPSPGE